MSKQFQRSVVCGKFCPPHLGHHYLIQTAIEQSEQVTVLVIDQAPQGFNVPAAQRALWLAEMHPQATIRVMPDILNDDRSDLWADATTAFLGWAPDAIFSSESYGDTWAKELGCEHVIVDQARLRVPISGTKVRASGFDKATLQMLHPVVRAAFVARICVVGAESTGSTTLATDLGLLFDEPVVPEYGRLRDEAALAKGHALPAWTSDEFASTAVIQQGWEDRLAREAQQVLFCDTDALATALWHERYHNVAHGPTLEIARSREYDLYIVTDHNGVGEEEDGMRFEMHRRPEMQEWFIESLEELGRPYMVVTGDRDARLAQAAAAVEAILNGTPGLRCASGLPGVEQGENNAQ